MNVELNVLERYSLGAEAVQPSLCCPVDYDPSLLTLLPPEIVEKDYGCGDPETNKSITIVSIQRTSF